MFQTWHSATCNRLEYCYPISFSSVLFQFLLQLLLLWFLILEYMFICTFPFAEVTSYDCEMKGDTCLRSSSSRIRKYVVCFCKVVQNNDRKHTTRQSEKVIQDESQFCNGMCCTCIGSAPNELVHFYSTESASL